MYNHHDKMMEFGGLETGDFFIFNERIEEVTRCEWGIKRCCAVFVLFCRGGRVSTTPNSNDKKVEFQNLAEYKCKINLDSILSTIRYHQLDKIPIIFLEF